jgi:hypothetical protein
VAALTAPAAPRPERASLRALRSLRDLAGHVAAAALTPHKASLARLADMPLAVIGTGLIDWSAFRVDQGVGLLATGISLWIVEHLIADSDDSAAL